MRLVFVSRFILCSAEFIQDIPHLYYPQAFFFWYLYIWMCYPISLILNFVDFFGTLQNSVTAACVLMADDAVMEVTPRPVSVPQDFRDPGVSTVRPALYIIHTCETSVRSLGQLKDQNYLWDPGPLSVQFQLCMLSKLVLYLDCWICISYYFCYVMSSKVQALYTATFCPFV